MCDGDTEKNINETVASEFRVRARFYAIRQVDGERAYDWYMRVRAAAVPCGFSDDQRTSTVTDKFVTGLRPGPVADRLLGERADGRLEDLLAVAVAAERADEERVEQRSQTSSSPFTFTKDVLTEIREGLKLYQYSSAGYANGVFDSDASDNCNHKSLSSHNGKLISNSKSKFGENSLWKNKIESKNKQYEMLLKNYVPLTCKSCCNLATRLLESFQEKTSLFHQLDINQNPEKNICTSVNYQTRCHNDSKCYCSWLTSSECKNNDSSEVDKSSNTISKYLDYTKEICCNCSISD